MTRGERRTLERAMAWRGTVSFSSAEGPSTRTCDIMSVHSVPVAIVGTVVYRTYTLVVDDLDDGSEAASEGVVASNDNNAANLDEAPVGSRDNSVAHCDDLWQSAVSSCLFIYSRSVQKTV